MQALVIGGLGVAWIAAFCYAGPHVLPGAWGYAPLAAAVACLCIAARMLRIIRSRHHGRYVEAKAIARAAPVLRKHGWDVQPNVTAPFGDIDLVVTIAGAPYPVEIKAYKQWSGHGIEREQRTLVQVERQRTWLHAPHGFIWLPDADASWWRRWRGRRHGVVTIVYGRAKHLRKHLERRA